MSEAKPKNLDVELDKIESEFREMLRSKTAMDKDERAEFRNTAQNLIDRLADLWEEVRDWKEEEE